MEALRIHIIDDNPTFLNIAVQYLNTCHNIKSIGWSLSLKDSVDRILSTELDFVLVDFSMPEQNGIDSLKFIKNKSNPPKVIIVSVNNEDVYREEAIKAGADGFICKSDFVDEVSKIFGK